MHLERGVSETNSRQPAFKERVIECAEDVCLLADASKTGVKSSFFFAQVADLTSLVTNRDADPGVTGALENLGVEALRA